MNLSASFFWLRDKLAAIYDLREATAISQELLTHVTGKDRLARLTDSASLLNAEQEELLHQALGRLMSGAPLQYVTGQAWFMERWFRVDDSVLIPRPETEELVSWILSDHTRHQSISVLDIGTGSGCIAITLKLAMPQANVTAIDVSSAALAIAHHNAERLGADIILQEVDFLEYEQKASLTHFDVLVSNPPYIPFSEADSLERNVRDFEPHTALFVPGHDALLFYRHLADFGKSHLNPGGIIYCENHRDYATDVHQLFVQNGYQAVLQSDMLGAPRMVKAWR